MARISRRTRNIVFWLSVGALISPLTFNCHSATDQSAAVSSASEGTREDDPDQTVRAMNTTADGAPEGASKVRLSGAATLSAAQATAAGLQGKLASPQDAIVAKGTSLLALYDNDCRGKTADSGLRFEAESFAPAGDTSLSVLAAEADRDPCLVRIDENKVYRMIAPISDSEQTSFKAQADLAALATVNDPRASEARQVIASKALQAWDSFFSGSGVNSDVIVAVVDTGVLYTHPDLADNIYTNTNGQHGFDFINNDGDPTDDYGHGTHVAGIIGARANNGVGITGVMGLHVKIMPVKVLDNQGSGSESSIANGIRYAADQGAHVINLSLGGKFASTSLRDAVSYAVGRGVVVIIAAGNDGVLMDASTNFYSPSGYAKDIPGSLAVGSVDSATTARSSFSNYSTAYVWIAAPGSNGILSTYLANGYTTLQGTSMASPVVAGAAALLIGSFRAHSISYTPQDITGLITESARPITALNANFRNGATLDIERAAKLFFSRYIMAGDGGTDVP